MAQSVGLHPLLDKGVKKGSSSFAGRRPRMRLHGPAGRGQGRRGHRSQPRLRLHAVLEAGPGAAFSIVAVAPSEKVTVAKNGDKLKVVNSAALIQTARLHRLRRPHARAGRAGPSLQGAFVHPSGTVPRGGLDRTRVRRLRFVSDRRRGQTRGDGGRTRPLQGDRARALRLPVAGAHGLHGDLDGAEERGV